MSHRLGLTVLVAFMGLSLACPLLDDDGGGGGGGSITFNNGFVYVRKDDRNVYVADESDYTRVGRLTSTGGARHPSLSKDGTQVVYVQTAGTETELSVVAVNAAGLPGTVFASTTTQRNFRNPVFSPDASQIAFAYDEGGASSVGIVNVDGTGFQRLAGGSALSYGAPSFYPDGTKVLAMAGNSSASFTQLESIDLTTRVATSVTNNLGTVAMQIVGRAVVSPDGTRAAFDARVSSGGVRIFVIDLSTKAVSQITEYPSDPSVADSSPTWVGTDRIGFSSDSGGADQVYALSSSVTKSSGGLLLPSAIEPWYGPN